MLCLHPVFRTFLVKMSKTNIENLCRICLNNSYLYSNIYVGNSTDIVPIYEAINFVYDLQISVDDGLPEFVCQECLSTVKEFKVYKTNAQKAKTELILLKRVSIKEEDVAEGDSVDIHSDATYDEGIACSQESGGVVLPKDELIAEDLISCAVKEEEPTAKENEDKFEVFAERIVADNSEEDEEGRCAEFSSGCYDEIMQKRKLNHFVDESQLQTSNGMRYVNCGRLEEEQNMVAFHYLHGYGAQQEKGEHAIKSRPAKGGSEREEVEMTSSEEVGNDQRNAEEDDAPSLWENNGSEGIKIEEELSDLRTEERHLFSVVVDGVKCHHCGDRREAKEELATHIQEAHGFGEDREDPRNELRGKGGLGKRSRVRDGRKRPVCSICDKRFKWKSNLEIHMRTHSGERPYKCTVCDSRFSQNSHLQGHMRMHTGEKPYKCPICCYRSSENGHLKTHMKTHSGNKLYKCSVCDYKCTLNQNLKRHMKRHTGEKPFECSICDYKCSENGNLKKHMRVHSGERPFQCSICNKRFSQNSHLKHHVGVHGVEKGYKCSICDYSCLQIRSFKRHVKTHDR